MIPIFEGQPPPPKQGLNSNQNKALLGCKYVHHERISDSKVELFSSGDCGCDVTSWFSRFIDRANLVGSLYWCKRLTWFPGIPGLPTCNPTRKNIAPNPYPRITNENRNNSKPWSLRELWRSPSLPKHMMVSLNTYDIPLPFKAPLPCLFTRPESCKKLPSNLSLIPPCRGVHSLKP